MAKKSEMQRLIRHYREATGKTECGMREVAEYAVKMGWPLPKPKDPLERLAEQFSDAAREETRKDSVTGNPYRANLAVTVPTQNGQLTLWADADEAPRPFAHTSFIQRREQIVDDAVQLTHDVNHWNRVNKESDPIQIPLDFTDDVQWRLNAASTEEQAA